MTFLFFFFPNCHHRSGDENSLKIRSLFRLIYIQKQPGLICKKIRIG